MNNETTVRILLVDDHAIVREGLRALLDDVQGMRIVGEATNGDEAVELAARLEPNLVLMDLKMPGLPAPDAIRTIRARNPSVHVLMLTSYAEDQQVQKVISAGALGYVLKDVAKAELVKAMTTVARGEPWLHAEAQRLLVNRMRKPSELNPLELLTDRERSVLKLLAQGQSNRNIGKSLQLTEGTVKGYVSNILAKLKLDDRTQAALLAVKLGADH
jgi:DNA-binding NarL/FixJ family response regulator